MLKIYLAGPDVFRPDAFEQGERLKALCAEFGLRGLYPLDHSVPEGIEDGVMGAAERQGVAGQVALGAQRARSCASA